MEDNLPYEEEDEEIFAEDEQMLVDGNDSAIPLDMTKVKSENGEEPVNMTSKPMTAVSVLKRKLMSDPKSSSPSRNEKIFKVNNSSFDSLLKEEEEDDDDEEGSDIQLNDRLEANETCDPERLKAFNMFVRLFVDENLDRMVPISRQPKEKIQAIIESCRRQFPEFAERARKRIRTYLKSCRRTRRHKSPVPSITSGKEGCDAKSIQQTLSTSSYHLTSAMAEQILANACENEYQNAKRMRLGLKPVAVSMNEFDNTNGNTFANTVSASSGNAVQVLKSNSVTASALRSQSKLECGASTTKANSVNYEHSFTNSTANHNQSHLRFSLNPSEMAAVKQLIAGYRESAAFLLRSADELEHLLLQQA
ncbi:uncharacterized protein B4U80_05237 [Leptotrombidium deliense]|uniref:Nucleolar protein 4 helical domain-containing protein n=1 Tax=Leptotrombidium deliense TaxID=299467 RepID=A0A443SEF5_9ACAR|nr:uncharacterized protein B4U80_05237 [Leptotrombidium deliense]